MSEKTGIIILAGQAGSGKDTVGNHIALTYGAATLGQADPMKRFAKSVFGFSDEQLWGPSEMRNAPDIRFYDVASIDWVDRNYSEVAEEWVGEVLWNLDIYQQFEALEKLDHWIESIYERIINGEGLSPRYVLQTLGTEWGRVFSNCMWIDYAIRTSEALLFGPNTYRRDLGVMFASKSRPLSVITDGRFRNEIAGAKKAGGVAIRIHRPTSNLSAAAENGGIKGHLSERELNDIPDSEFDAVIENVETLQNLYLMTDLVLSRFYPGLTRPPVV